MELLRIGIELEDGIFNFRASRSHTVFRADQFFARAYGGVSFTTFVGSPQFFISAPVATLQWWGGLCASVTLGAIPAGVRPLAGSTKLGRFQGRGQTKGNTCSVILLYCRYKCAKMHRFLCISGVMTP